MHSTILLGAMMAIGAAAVPNPAVTVVDVYTTVTVTLASGQHEPTAAPKPKVPAPAPVPAAPKASGLGFLQTPKPAPKPATGGSSSGPLSGGDILGVANKYREMYNLSPLTYDASMESNCAEVGQQGHGVQEIHKLIPGAYMGQVITPGSNDTSDGSDGYSPFEIAYLAWLCECPDDPQLQPAMNDGNDVCAIVQDKLHMQYADTGHHDIIVDPKCKTIACDFTPSGASGPYKGLWVCDFGME